MSDFQTSQTFLVKDTLKNYFMSRGLLKQAEAIKVETTLDRKDEKVMALLGLVSEHDEQQKWHDLFDTKIKNLDRKNIQEYQTRELEMEKLLDAKLVHLHKVVKHEIEKSVINVNPSGIDKTEVIRMIKDARARINEDSRKMLDDRFPRGFDSELQNIIQKKGNLTENEIFRARTAILRYSSENVTTILTQLMNYGDEDLHLETESEFLKFFITPLASISPTGRYGQNLIMLNVFNAWSELVSNLTNPGNICCSTIIMKLRTIYYGCEDLGTSEFAFAQEIQNICLEIACSNSDQITNIEMLNKIQDLVPKNLNENWSFKPMSDLSNLGRTAKQWTTQRLNRQINRCYIDIGLEGDLLSTPKTKQCFPIPYGGESPKNHKKFMDQISENTPNDGNSGFFNFPK